MISRRDLLFGAAALVLLPVDGRASYSRPVAVLKEPFQTIAVVQRDLFPGGKGVPFPQLLQALEYLGGVMNDPYVERETKVFLADGAQWLNEEAQAACGRMYYHLTAEQRQQVLQTVSEEGWGDNWLWRIVSYLFEALLGDPVYGINTHEAGWHWLGHEPGYPRPKAPFI